MADLLDTYRSGRHEAAWLQLAERPDHPDADALARETMRRVAAALALVRDELPALGWRFDDPELVLPGPDPGAPAVIDEFERAVGPLPLALRALATEVGPVSLLGRHPAWPLEQADPVVIDPFWADLREEHEQHSQWGTLGELDSGGTFPMPLAPDALHKADVSGGPPYAVALPDTTADPAWLDDPTHPDATLLGYLRSALLTSAGLPGWQRRPDLDVPAELTALAARLPAF